MYPMIQGIGRLSPQLGHFYTIKKLYSISHCIYNMMHLPFLHFWSPNANQKGALALPVYL